MTIDLTGVLALLPSWQSNEAELLGLVEDQDLEFKSLPWDVRLKPGKLEFAKDVSAMANGGGGLIVLGLRTERTANVSRDEVVEVTPFDPAHLNRTQLLDLATTWLYPPMRDLSIQVYPSDDGESCLASAFVRRLPGFQLLLIHGAEIDDGVVKRSHFGAARRFGDRVAFYGPDEIHQWISDGRRFGLTGRTTGSTDSEGAVADAESNRKHMTEVYSEDDWPVAIVQLFPPHGGTIVGLHDDAGPKGCIRRHESLRGEGGFNLRVVSDIESGSDFLDVNLGMTQRLRVTSTGCATLAVSLSPSGMSWAMDRHGDLPYINPTYLAEVVYDLASMYVEAVVPFIEPPMDRVQATLAIERADRPAAVGLQGGMPNWMSLEPPKRLSESEWETSVSFDAPVEPKQIAAEILRGFYGAFGLGIEAIPFVDAENGEFDPNRFLELSKR